MAAGENLHDRAATGMPVAFDDIAFDLASNQKFQARKFCTEAGQSHEQFGRFRSASSQSQLGWSVGFKNKYSARPQTKNHLRVDFAPNRRRLMGKNCDDSSPNTRLDGEVFQASKHRFNFNAACRRESPGFG